MTRTLRKRTWPVFLVGLGSLLGLLFIPGLTALKRTDEIYREIRAIQSAQEETQRSLVEVERRMYLVSIAVREALLDTAPVTGGQYRDVIADGRQAINTELGRLKRKAGSVGARQFARLETELSLYWDTLEPVFTWTPEQRAASATYFLREQQRPRRQSVLAIARTVSTLIQDSYQKQYDSLNASQRDFRRDIERNVAVAFLIGVAIAGGSIVRISTLEARSDRQRREAEQAEDQLRLLSNQLMNAQEAERKALSRELHDEVGQMLTGLRMEIAALDRSRHDEPTFNEHLTGARSLSEQTLRVVRDLAVGLRPSVLDLGLAPALQWQARQFSRMSGIRASVNVEGDVDALPEQHSTCIYRVVQESLTNAGKHSGASTVNVQLRGAEGQVELTVEDDGAGFADQIAVDTGLGLLGMRERVRELGARLIVDSRPGFGTSLHVTFPLSRNGKQPDASTHS